MAQTPSVDNTPRKPLDGVDNLIATKTGEMPAVADDKPNTAEPASATLDELPHLDGAPAPSFWDDLRDSLPPWLDEILAITLLIFGILSFLALFNPSGAVVAETWANQLNQYFGRGSVIVAGGIFLLGVLILLPKTGLVLRYPPSRILAIEATFLCVLALLHLTDASGASQSVARAGSGGGSIGWGLIAFPYWLLGRTLSMLIFSIFLAISLAALFGIGRSQAVTWLDRAGQRLLVLSMRQSGQVPTPQAAEAPVEVADTLGTISQNKTVFMRIQPNLKNLPPSLRAALLASEPEEDEVDLSQHPLFQSETEALKADFNMVGEMLNKKSDDGTPLVMRPDGREKRYFSASEIKEEKRTGRRSDYLPSLDILRETTMELPEDEEINHKVVLIENTLLEFDVDIDVIDVQVGPTVTRYAVQPYHSGSDGTTERIRLSKIAAYHSDLALALSARRLRLEIPVPGTNYMGIEVPNQKPSMVSLRSVYQSKPFYDLAQKSSSSPLTVPLGRDVSGQPVGIDVAKMPHLLIAGTTGSGKSVCIGALASAVLLGNHPDKVKLIMLDPKMVELSRFNGLPHLIGPVETDVQRIIGVLKWCTIEMDRRYKLLEEHAVRNIDGYNEKVGHRRRGKDYMPHIMIMIDEIGDLMMSQPDETERTITRLAQMARAVGMHLVIATQRPSVDVITGLIKANFPGRIAFSVASGIDSRVILDATGAEQLMGQGDMLYLPPDAGAPMRVQGCFISDDEVRDLVRHWQRWNNAEIKAGNRKRIRVGPWERGLTRREFLSETDPMLEEAIEYVVSSQEASASVLQRELNLGYPRAARIIDMLAEMGVIGEPVGGGRARKVLIPRGEDPFKRLIDKRLEEERQKALELKEAREDNE